MAFRDNVSCFKIFHRGVEKERWFAPETNEGSQNERDRFWSPKKKEILKCQKNVSCTIYFSDPTTVLQVQVFECSSDRTVHSTNTNGNFTHTPSADTRKRRPLPLSVSLSSVRMYRFFEKLSGKMGCRDLSNVFKFSVVNCKLPCRPVLYSFTLFT